MRTPCNKNGKQVYFRMEGSESYKVLDRTEILEYLRTLVLCTYHMTSKCNFDPNSSVEIINHKQRMFGKNAWTTSGLIEMRESVFT